MTIQRALDLVQRSEDGAYGILLEHGTMELGFYKPQGVDPQQPGEGGSGTASVLFSGTGWFVCGDRRDPFEPGEALFVPAGVVHRFEDFSDDFAAWVVFDGPKGGEG